MIKVNGDRLWKRLMEMSKIGGTAKGGVCRVALTDEDKQGRDLFIKWAKEAGCNIEIDKIGNIYATRPGKDNSKPSIMIGSHLDSQPTGGKFDGVLGVLAGLEIMDTLNDLNIVTEIPVEIVSWTNEEGARFSPAMIASGVFSGDFSLDYAYERTDKEGKTLGEELERIGYKGSMEVGNRPYKATFELHIEQGPILEAKNKSVGIVTGVQGIRWYDLVLNGKETHAGPSPMEYRKDPVKALTEILPQIYRLAEIYSPDAKVTVGYIDAIPGVRNTVPGSLIMAIDLRHPDETVLSMLDKDLEHIITSHDGKLGVTSTLKEIWYSPPVKFSKECIDAVKNAAHDLKIPTMEIVSGAGHDAVYVSKVAPTSMIFIPCKEGLSHNEMESAKKVDVINGTNVLLNAVLQMAGIEVLNNEEILNKSK